MFRTFAWITASVLGLVLAYWLWAPRPAGPPKSSPLVTHAPLQTPFDQGKQSLPAPRPYSSRPATKAKNPAGGEESLERHLARLKQALALDPENPQLLYELGLALAKDMHAPEEGIPHLEKALKIDSNNGTAFYDLVGAYLESGNIKRGAAFLEDMARSADNKGAAYAALGDLRSASGDPVGALPDVQRAHEADPNSPAVTALLASTYLQTGDPRAEDAMKLAEQQQLGRIRELGARGETTEFAQREYDAMVRGRADYLSQNRRWTDLEQMAAGAQGSLKTHIDTLLRQGGG